MRVLIALAVAALGAAVTIMTIIDNTVGANGTTLIVILMVAAEAWALVQTAATLRLAASERSSTTVGARPAGPH